MPLQRTCDAENQVRYILSNGPLRAQSKAHCFAEYSATLKADVICRGYVSILLSARSDPWIKVAPRIKFFIRPWQKESSVKGVFLVNKRTQWNLQICMLACEISSEHWVVQHKARIVAAQAAEKPWKGEFELVCWAFVHGWIRDICSHKHKIWRQAYENFTYTDRS